MASLGGFGTSQQEPAGFRGTALSGVGMGADLDGYCSTPWMPGFIESWARLTRDPGVVLVDWLRVGAPAGTLRDTPDVGWRLPSEEPGRDPHGP